MITAMSTITLSFAATGRSILISLEEHKVDKHEGAEEGRFGLDVEVLGKGNAEVVGVGEGLAKEPRPLLCHGADLVLLAQVQHLAGGKEVMVQYSIGIPNIHWLRFWLKNKLRVYVGALVESRVDMCGFFLVVLECAGVLG